MSSLESTNLILISLLELPNIGRKTIFNFLSNFEKEKKSELFSDNKHLYNKNINESILERSGSFNSKYFEQSLTFEKIIDPHFMDYKIHDNISNDFQKIFLEKFKIS